MAWLNDNGVILDCDTTGQIHTKLFSSDVHCRLKTNILSTFYTYTVPNKPRKIPAISPQNRQNNFASMRRQPNCNSSLTRCRLLDTTRPRYMKNATYHLNRVLTNPKSTAVGQVVACALVTQRARVRCPVGTSFMVEVFSGFFFTCKTNVGKLQAPKVPEYHLAIIITHHSLRAPMT